MPEDADFDALVQKDRIRDLVYVYCRAVDRLDYELLADLYWPGALDDHGFNPEGTAENFLETLKQIYAGASAIQHHVTNLHIRLDGERAEAEGYLLNTQTLQGSDGPYRMVAGGRYMDRLEQRDGVWKFVHRRLVMDWANALGPDNMLDHNTVSNLVSGEAGAADPSYGFLSLFGRGVR